MKLDSKRVVVGMSGGVDSSVAAILLHKQGYEVIGATISPFKIENDCRVDDNPKSCCSFKSVADAHEVCNMLGIEHKLIEMSARFRTMIVDNFINEYMSGRTPNPCVICNPNIKWQGMLEKADSMGAGFVSTGHYAIINYDEETKRYYISKGTDKTKDQSYVLWNMTQEQLSRTILPLSNYPKTEIRKIAKEYRLPVFDKPDSQEICFIKDDDYGRFLRENVEGIESLEKGEIMYEGNKIGKHKGFPFYTIGQRKGLGISHKEPLFVKTIDFRNNVIEVSRSEGLLSKTLFASSVNLMKYEKLDSKRLFKVKIRYKDSGEEAWCESMPDGKLKVEFLEPRRAITPGQSVVLYEGEDLVGGGIIDEFLN
ncbi:MAG: tRNA-specific 2-thiouridylase MnmA [Ignavibacteria bacterium]|nr:tRNA-specific 2-thiouridylase MnmA [Ignavibacteria bacterium]